MNIFKKLFKSNKYWKAKQIIDDIESGKIGKFGILDYYNEGSGCGGFPLYEARIVSIEDYEKGLIVIELIDTKQIIHIQADRLYIEYNKREDN